MVLVRRHGGGKMRWFSKVNMRKPIAKRGSLCLFNFLLSIKLMIVDMTRHSTPRRPGVLMANQRIATCSHLSSCMLLINTSNRTDSDSLYIIGFRIKKFSFDGNNHHVESIWDIVN